MSWFTRKEKGISTPTSAKKEAPDGLWYKCPKCKTVILTKVHMENVWTCTSCEHHERIGSEEYFSILFDDNQYAELDENLISGDPLHFKDTKNYTDRIRDTIAKTGLKDAVRTAVGKADGQDLVVACMDFGFMGGSMGSVVGEKIARSIDYARENRFPILIISRSGGARMMEAGFSLMQMAKILQSIAVLKYTCF